jgi:hypothetical protein
VRHLTQPKPWIDPNCSIHRNRHQNCPPPAVAVLKEEDNQLSHVSVIANLARTSAVKGVSIAHYQQPAASYLVPKSRVRLLSKASLLQANPDEKITAESDKLTLSGILSELTKGSIIGYLNRITIYRFRAPVGTMASSVLPRPCTL